MEFKKRYGKLNKEQRAAVENIEGPLLVVAGPGSGKTELLGIRAANILRKTDTPPRSILNLTFTDAASLNMRERLIELIGEDAYRIPVYTFHSFALDIIESYPELFYKGAKFNLADEATKVNILEDILKNLDYDNPLTSVHPELGYVYLEDIKKSIAFLKEEGIRPFELKEILQKNKKDLPKINSCLQKVFQERVSAETISKAKEIIPRLRRIRGERALLHFYSLPFVVAENLEKLVESGDTRKFSQWKEKMTKKEKQGRVLKDSYYIDKMESFAETYEKYQEEMYKQGYYDFSDMLLDAIDALEKNEAARYELQEKYLYVQVDEFQDTSGVQMRLLYLLTKDEIHGKPNICVVGDDDQAIYRFQGAEISNILHFRKRYKEVKVITLVESYRSTQDILDVARKIILKGEERLEAKFPEIRKDLVSGKGKKKGEIRARFFTTKEEEYSYVAQEVKKKLDKGLKPEEISVIARTHHILKQALPYFNALQIPVFMERKENVLEKEHIIQLTEIVRFAVLLFEGDRERAEELLPEILSYPFWKIKREKVWQTAVRSFQENKPWMECMKEDKELNKIGDFLLDLACRAKIAPAEEIIDIVIGNKKGTITSPFKDYYFGKKVFQERKEEYLDFLSSLKRFIKAIREHKGGRMIKAKDLIRFVDLHKDNDIPVLDKQPLVTEKGNVFLITAHGAKGREFEAVFVLNCQQEVWGRKRKHSKLIFPSNVPLDREAETYDDQLRLFYVTLTRAKKCVCFTFHKQKEGGRGFIPLEFINGIEAKQASPEVDVKAVSQSLNPYSAKPLSSKEKDFLLPLVENYKLSVTGFTKFLNVAREGPQSFLEDSLLRFPRKKSLALSFGTAVHESIKELYIRLKKEGKLIAKKELLRVFAEFLEKERLSEKDFKKAEKRGRDALSLFYDKKKKSFSINDEIERNFRNQGCRIGETDITGKIDKIVKDEGEAKVVDFKTGKPLTKWNEAGEDNKIKAWRYRHQLIFYKLLIENSRDFHNYRVSCGILEFIEPTKDKELVTLDLEIKDEEKERTKELVKIVGRKIKNLKFPSAEKYKKEKLEEIKRFEDDLLSGKV